MAPSIPTSPQSISGKSYKKVSPHQQVLLDKYCKSWGLTMFYLFVKKPQGFGRFSVQKKWGSQEYEYFTVFVQASQGFDRFSVQK